MHLNVFVSPKCFLYCKGCYSISREEDLCNKIPTDKIVEFLEYVYENDIKKVTICGGDPLTRCDILELLEKIKNIGFFISLDTVGTSIIKAIKKDGKIIVNEIDVKKLAELVDMIGIPIDGSTNEIFKLFRQTNDDIINEQLSICNKLNEYNANICINTVVHKGNIKDSINLTKVINNLKFIKKWQIFQFMPIGKFGNLNKENFEITKDEFSKFKYDVLKNYENDKCKLEFKNSVSRDKSYILIDNSGNAWISSYLSSKSDRIYVGNILHSNDWEKIIFYLKKEERGEI